jgi:adenylate cyclase
MVLFNAPMWVENHELRAVEMALAMRESMTSLSAGWLSAATRSASASPSPGGYATIGTIGFEQRLDETALTAVDGAALRGGPAGIATPA